MMSHKVQFVSFFFLDLWVQRVCMFICEFMKSHRCSSCTWKKKHCYLCVQHVCIFFCEYMISHTVKLVYSFCIFDL